MTTSSASQSFGTLLRRYRAQAALSQEMLAERAGMSLRGLSDLERGRSRRPRLYTLGRLADALSLESDARAKLFAAASPIADDQPTEAASVSASAGRRATRPALPGYLTRLVGREQDIAAVGTLLSQPELRLLTLIGPGGVGKTRLAVQVATEYAGLFADGVVLAALAPLRDAQLVPAAIAQAVGLSATANLSLPATLAQVLQAQRLLLILDNFEHVLSEAPLVADLLVQCPNLRVLVTSRTALQLDGEYRFVVRPLGLPATHAASIEAADTSPAVTLFLQRAQSINSSFGLTAANADDIVAVCRRLDGLPLALELAAARSAVLSPAGLLARLDQPVSVLTRGSRDAPARHRALRDAIAWSYDLLREDEQRLFRRLSVFAGGWTLADAERVCAEPNAESDVLNGLSNLIEQSLVQPTSDAMGETRFSLLETIRADALHRLDGSGEGGRLRERHADNYLHLAEEAEPHLVTAQRLPWLRRLDSELDNMRAVLAWSVSRDGDPEVGRQVLGSLSWFWYLRGHLQEGRMWAERLLALTPDGSSGTPGRARALYTRGGIVLMQGDPATARSPLEQCIALFQAQGDRTRLSYALSLLGLAHAGLREPLIALQMYNECLELARASGDSWLQAWTLTNQGAATTQLHDLTIAEEHYRAGLTLFEQLDDAWGRAIALRALGGLAVDRGDAVGARVHYERSVQLFRQTGDIRGLAQALLGLGRLALRSAEPGYARDVFVEALARWQELGILEGIIRCLSGLADVAAAVNQPDRSARLYAAAGVQAARISVVSAAADTNERQKTRTAIGLQIGAARYRAAWATGEAMTLDQAIAEALSEY